MRRFASIRLVVTLLLGLGSISQVSAQQPLTDDRVTAALTRGVDALLKSRTPAGTWEHEFADPASQHHGGETSLALYALLHVGENLPDKRLKSGAEELQKAIAFVRELKPKSVYAASLQANALALLPRKPENTKPLEQTRRALAGAMLPDNGFGYDIAPNVRFANSDNSNSQYAALGLWAAYDAGIGSPVQMWKTIEDYWRKMAQPDGGWYYRGDRVQTNLAMTAAGVQCILIATEHTDRALRLEMRNDKQLVDGMRYLGEKWAPEKLDLYGLYGVERVGLLSGAKFFGRRNWYVEGAEHLLTMQLPEGHWRTKIWDVTQPHVSTSFALLFLARGRNPVLFNKLQYDGPWHARTRDLAGLAEWMSNQYERPFNWQTVSSDVHPDEWLDAPALLITGAQDPKFTPQQQAALRSYVNAGGLVFSVQIGGSKGKPFGDAIRSYATAITGNKAEFRKLGAEAPVLSSYGKIKNLPSNIEGLSNGVRELWIHTDEDLSAAWQTNNTTTPAFDIAANIYFYACGREELRTKLASTAVPNAPGKAARTISLARIKWGGETANWDAEPGAFERLGRLLENKSRSNLVTETVNLAALEAKTNRLAWLNGVGKMEPSPEEEKRLKAFFDGGGLMIADAVGGDREFATSFEALIEKLYPKGSGAKFDLLDQAHSAFSGTYEDGEPLTSVKYRALTRQTIGDVTTPKCWGLTVNNRLVLVWSPHDLSSGLAGARAWGISGYTIESADVLSRNMVLYCHALALARGR